MQDHLQNLILNEFKKSDIATIHIWAENKDKEYLEIILDEANKMNHLVQDLLNISQIESGKKDFKFTEFSVRSFVEDTVKLFSLVFKEKSIKIVMDVIDNIVFCDYEQMQSVLTNFISNAINHIDGRRVITINSELLDDSSVVIRVLNTGKNIPEDEIKNIWESFYKVDKARTRAYGGQGLGLSICKTTLNTLGYSYGVNNHKNGVEFYFEIYNNKKG